MTLSHLCLCTYWVFYHLYLSHDCVWITNLLWIVVVQVCTGFLWCIDQCVSILFIICVIGSLCLSWKLPPMVYSLLSFWCHGWSSNGGISLGHEVYPGFSFHVAIMGFFTAYTFDERDYWPQGCIFWCFIPWKPYSILHLQKTHYETDICCICV